MDEVERRKVLECLLDTGMSLPSDHDKNPRLKEKHARFEKLAEKRTGKAIESIDMIGKLANRQSYSYERHEVQTIVEALQSAVSRVEVRFSGTSGRGRDLKLWS